MAESATTAADVASIIEAELEKTLTEIQRIAGHAWQVRLVGPDGLEVTLLDGGRLPNSAVEGIIDKFITHDRVHKLESNFDPPGISLIESPSLAAE